MCGAILAPVPTGTWPCGMIIWCVWMWGHIDICPYWNVALWYDNLVCWMSILTFSIWIMFHVEQSSMLIRASHVQLPVKSEGLACRLEVLIGRAQAQHQAKMGVTHKEQ